jgi:imidazolonepropionase-like amidohydrolase
MVRYITKVKVFTAKWIFDGTGRAPIEEGIILVEEDKVVAIGAKDQIPLPMGSDVTHIDLGDGFVLPGLIDVHSHLVLPGDEGPVEKWMQHNDGILLMQAAKNARRALETGITTQADLGARNQVSFTLRKAINMGLTIGPRLILSGRSLTRRRGHCWFFNGEADGPDEIRKSVRQLVGEGADIIKVMATGGGTQGTDPFRPAYDLEELEAATRTAHLLGRKALAHCSSSEAIRMALEAGFDMIVHAHFYKPNGQRKFQPSIALSLADSNAYVNPTLQVNLARIRSIQAKSDMLSDREKRMLDNRLLQFEEVAEMVKLGVKLVAGSDAGWVVNPFGNFVSELEALVSVGLSTSDTLVAATRDAARSIGCENMVGTLEPGKKADLLVVSSDPTLKISALRKIQSIWLGGKQVLFQ